MSYKMYVSYPSPLKCFNVLRASQTTGQYKTNMDWLTSFVWPFTCCAKYPSEVFANIIYTFHVNQDKNWAALMTWNYEKLLLAEASTSNPVINATYATSRSNELCILITASSSNWKRMMPTNNVLVDNEILGIHIADCARVRTTSWVPLGLFSSAMSKGSNCLLEK